MERVDSLTRSLLPSTQRQCLDLTSLPSTHSYPTRNTTIIMEARDTKHKTSKSQEYINREQSSCTETEYTGMSPLGSQKPKSVAFELLFTQSPQHRARIPMRVQIFPHDTTESIVTTVKNFYGLYPSPNYMKGVSFEDEEGNTLIARYENFRNNMIVYVRVINEPIPLSGIYDPATYSSESTAIQQTYDTGDNHTLPPQSAQVFCHDQSLSRPTSRTSNNRSSSPNQGRGSRNISTSTNPLPVKKTRSRSGPKGRGSSVYSNLVDGYSSGEGTSGSVATKTKSEHIGSTEISLDNIVEGGRRKRAKFESSELPLFAPPQMPAATSNSSISPARRIDHQRPTIYTNSNSQHPFSTLQQLQSPQGPQNGFGQAVIYTTPGTENRRTRGDLSNRHSINSTPSCNSSGVIPTPDPTVGSCMSEEDKDVALQLIRLGELSNISHGRTSASTLDDTFSGKADAASSTGITSESESEFDLPQNHRVKRETSPILPPSVAKNFRHHSGDNLPSQDSTEPSCDDGEYEDRRDETFKPRLRENFSDNAQGKSTLTKSKSQPGITTAKPRNGSLGTKVKSSKSKAQQRIGQNKAKKLVDNKPISPASLPPQSRKTSNASVLNLQRQLREDEEDLSSKPRCQRCRKSKKGCDRQRPCQRCKDAGLSADQCISEDEGNGRKGRYGRHMGVPVKKEQVITEIASHSSLGTAGSQGSPSKKRKR